MNFSTALRLVCASAMLGAALGARAESLASSASSAGSASSGSVSGSLRGSSKSSTGGDHAAAVDYQIIDVGPADRPGLARITLQASDRAEQLVLELPQAIAAQQKLAPGDRVQTRPRVYGFEFARGDTRDAFYLVLTDDWYGDLAARPLGL